MKRSIRISHQDDEGKWIYTVTETVTVTKVIKEVPEEEFQQVSKEVHAYNKENSDYNRFRLNVKEQSKNRTKEENLDLLYRTGMIYSNGQPRQYDENGDLIPLSKLEEKQ